MAINKTEIQAILTTDVSKWTVDDMNKVRMFILDNILNTSGKSNIGYETYQKINEAITEAVEGAKTYDDVLKKIDAKLKSGLLNEIRSSEQEEHKAEIAREYLKLQIGIDEEYEKHSRSLSKINQLVELNKKALKEGLTFQEKTTKWLTQVGERFLNTDKFKNGLNEVKVSTKGLVEATKGLMDVWGKVDQSAADYARAIGGSAKSMEALRKSTIDFVRTQNIGAKYNVSMEELIKLQSSYNSSIGRSIDLTNTQKESMAAMRKVAGEDVAVEFSQKLENFGLNPDEAGKRMGEMFSTASKKGIVFEKYSKNFLSNIQMAQNYTFTNGLKGLASMAEKATSIRLDMQQAQRFADKVSSLEGAMQAGASLSVLGGSFAQYGNPLSMLYEGLNDMEGMQDRIIKMFGNMGKWDYSKGQVDISAFNRQRIKAAAEATGMDYSNLMESINAQARQNIVGSKLVGRSDLSSEMIDLIKNTAQLDENGNAFVSINGQRKDVSKLTNADQKALSIQHNSESDNIKTIAEHIIGWEDVMSGFRKQIDAQKANMLEVTGIGKAVKDVTSWMSKIGLVTGSIAGIETSVKVIEAMMAAGGFLNGIGNMATSFGKGAGKMESMAGNTINGVGKASTYKNGFGAFGMGKKWGTDAAGHFRSGGKITKATGGMKFMNGVGRMGVGAGAITGLAGGIMDIGTEAGYASKRKDNGYVGLKTGSRALEIAGTGAMLGSMFGPVGTLVGAGVGLLAGGTMGYIQGKKNQLKDNIYRDKNVALVGDYSINELKAIMHGQNGVSSYSGLADKMIAQGDDPGLLPQYYGGTPFVDRLMARLNPGEAVIPANVVKRNQKLVSKLIKSDKDSINSMSVLPNVQNNSNNGPSSIKIEPLQINIGGTITIDSKDLGFSKILTEDKLFKQEIINKISKEIERQISFGFNKENFVNKFTL